MNTLLWIITILNLLAILVAGFFLKNYFPAYFTEKAKNLAKKEDIKEITDKIESARSHYNHELETLKASLDKGRYAHQRQFDLELEVYKSLWKELVALREATASLRPMMDSGLGEGQTEESRKRERAEKFVSAFNPFGKTIEENRPFYSQEVWGKVWSLRELAWKEAVDYRFSDQGRDWEKYWGNAERNLKAIQAMSDEVCESIRQRISHLNSCR